MFLRGDLSPEAEDHKILERLGIVGTCRPFPAIHVARPEGQQAVERLHRRGLVDYRWGDDALDGVMIVVRRASAMVAPFPRGGLIA